MNKNRINIRAAIIATLLILAIGIANYLYLQNRNNTTLGNSKTTTQDLVPDTSVIIDTEMDDSIRQKTLSQRLDRELPQAQYISIQDTDLEIKIPSSYSISQTPDQIRRQTPWDKIVLAVSDKESTLFWNVTECDYEYNRVPGVTKSLDESSCKKLLAKYPQKQLEAYQDLRVQHNFFIDIINTSLTPQQWVLDNVVYQGVKLRDQSKEISRGIIHIINGFSYLAINVACCGGYEMNYFTQYQNTAGNKILLKFGTNDFDGNNTGKDNNTVLDKLLLTIKRK